MMSAFNYERAVRPWILGFICAYIAFLLGARYIATGAVNVFGAFPLVGGFVFFLRAKLSVKYSGEDPWLSQRLFADAAELMSPDMRVSYYLGYFLMIAGFFLSFPH